MRLLPTIYVFYIYREFLNKGFNISACDWSVLFIPDLVLGDCTFLRICLFVDSCPFDWHIVVVGNLL